MNATHLSPWQRFWFQPSPVEQLRTVRRGLAIVTAIYFLSALPDVATWLAPGAPASGTNLSTFFRTAELTDDARWMISPLYLVDALLGSTPTWMFQAYLLIGIALSLIAGFPELWSKLKLPQPLCGCCGGCLPGILLWIWFVGWANRTMLLAGIVEPVLGVSLAALAIAPTGFYPSANTASGSGQPLSWRTTLATRLISVQATLIAMTTTATMLASTTWWNGTGAYALIAPVEDRWFDVRETLFEAPLVYELTTALIVLGLPAGIFLAWRSNSHAWGVRIIIAWCVLTGLLSAEILYPATLAIIATTMGNPESDHTTAGADGAEWLNGGGVETTS